MNIRNEYVVLLSTIVVARVQLKYFDCLRQVISCSNDENSAVVIGCVRGSTNLEAHFRDLNIQGASYSHS